MYSSINNTYGEINDHILRIEQAINEIQGDIETKFKQDIEDKFMQYGKFIKHDLEDNMDDERVDADRDIILD